MSNINVTYTENSVTVNEVTSNVSVIENTDTINVSEGNSDVTITETINTITVGETNIVAPSEVRNLLSNTAPITYNSTTGVIGLDSAASFIGKTTDDLPQGTTNLYFSNALSRASISATAPIAYDANTGVISYSGTQGDITEVIAGAGLTGGGSSGDVTLAVGAGTGITVNADNVAVNMSAFTTTDLAEGANLYYTTDRANTAIDTRVTKTFVDALGVEYSSLANAPTNVSFFTNDAGYLVAANLASLTANVDSVNGQTGVVSLDTGDIPENGNLYFTTDRANNATVAYLGSNDITIGGNLDVQGNIDYINVVDMLVNDNTITLNYGNATARDAYIYIDRSGSALNNSYLRWNETDDRWEINDGSNTYILPRSTTDLAEGANLYYTTDRANTAIADKLIDSSQKKIFNAAVQDLYLTPDAANATGGYYMPNSPGSIGDVLQLTGGDQADWQRLDTGDVDEGANLYYTTDRANSAIDNYVVGSENITVNSGTIALTNALGNVYSITTDGQDFTINTNSKLILTEQFKGVTTYTGNINGDGYAIFRGSVSSAQAPFLSHSGSGNLDTFKFVTAEVTAGSPVISNVTIVDMLGSSANISSITQYYAPSLAFGQADSTPFPPGTYVDSVDVANSTITMSQNSSLTDNTLLPNGVVYPGAYDSSTGLLIGFISLNDATGGGVPNRTTIAGIQIMKSGAYGYPVTGPVPSDFAYSVDTDSDYSSAASITNRMIGRTNIVAPRTVFSAPRGLVVGDADLTNRAENDQFPSFGVNILWDGLSNTTTEYSSNPPVTQLLIKNYTDNNFQNGNRLTGGPRLFFTAAEGNKDLAYGETYPRENLELGRITWWNATQTSAAPSSTVPPSWISGVTGQDCIDYNSGVGMYFANSPDITSDDRGLYFANTKGNTLVTGGPFASSKIRLAAMNTTSASGNSVQMYENSLSNIFVEVGYANTSAGTGSEITLTNGTRATTGVVGDLVLAFDRNDNASNNSLSVGKWSTGNTTNLIGLTSGIASNAIVMIYTSGIANPLVDGQAVTITGATGDPANSNVNSNVFYVDYRGTTGSDNWYVLYNDSALTSIKTYDVAWSGTVISPPGLEIETGTWGGTFEYTQASDITTKNWSVSLEEQSEDLKFKANGTTVATITDAGNVIATTFIGNIDGATGDFTGTVTATAFIGDGSDVTDVRAKTVEEKVINKSGGTLPKGTPVYATGGVTADALWVAACDASNAATMPCIGVLATSLDNDVEGRAIVTGTISGVDTSTFTAGDQIYIAVGGGYANVAPAGEANIVQHLGIVTRVDASQGGGIVNIESPHDVKNLNNGNIFIGNSSNVTVTKPLVTAITDANVKLKQFAETVVDLGNVTGDISANIDVANGTIYKMSTTGSITINSLASATAGTSATLIITNGGSHTLSSTMKFAGGSKTLSTGAGDIDIVSVFYDGSTYYATLSKGYA